MERERKREQLKAVEAAIDALLAGHESYTITDDVGTKSYTKSNLDSLLRWRERLQQEIIRLAPSGGMRMRRFQWL